MDLISSIKLGAAISILIVFSITGTIELLKNPKYWLNRMFALFFYFTSLGLIVYTSYHFVYDDPSTVLVLVYIAQTLFNMASASLLMVIFIVNYSERAVMRPKFLGIVLGFLLIMTIGYFIWPPEVNMEEYAQGIVTTEIPEGWNITITLLRVFVYVLAIVRFHMIGKKSEGKVQSQLRFFEFGMLSLTIGLFSILLGSTSPTILIVGVIIASIGAFVILRGFLK